MSIMRVREGVAATVWDATVGGFVALVPGVEYDSADLVVKANGWAFQSDAQSSGRANVRSVRVEQATAAPGERR